MDSFSIGISGLHAAQKGFEIIGNNVANAATEGYHRQRIDLAPAYTSQLGSLIIGGGVDVVGVTRLIDGLLDEELYRQESLLQQVSQEVATLRTIENSFGEFSEGNGLSEAIDEFFNALQDLSAHPTETIWQNQIVSAAQTMTGRFRTLGEYLTKLENQIVLEAENSITQVNILINKIAQLNDNIEKQEIGGGKANNLRDQRDESIAQLSKLIAIEAKSREHGVIDVYVSGTPVVVSATVTELDVGMQQSNVLGVSVAGSYNFNINPQSGRLGGLLSLRNDLITNIHNNLDDLATALIQQINQYHVQGVGSTGSFTELTGWPMASENLADFDPPVSDGNIHIRVTNTSTGAITRTPVPINASSDTLSSIANYITTNVTGVTASVVSSKLHIQADTNYKFDFIPAVLPLPTNSTLTGSPPTISVSGIYTGTSNDTFTFTVVGNGQVGIDPVQLEVRNGALQLVTTLNVGSGYAAGDKLDIGNGIKISLSAGTLNNTETFAVDAFANSDTSGVLAAVGLNTFFSGSSASDMAVCSDIATTPGRVAAASGADMTDNTNASRMANLREQTVTSLNSMTFGEFYRKMITDIGQELFVKQTHKDNLEAMIQNLGNQQSEISGVNINDEATRILLFEQMFKAMSKYLSTIQSSLIAIMEIL